MEAQPLSVSVAENYQLEKNGTPKEDFHSQGQLLSPSLKFCLFLPKLYTSLTRKSSSGQIRCVPCLHLALIMNVCANVQVSRPLTTMGCVMMGSRETMLSATNLVHMHKDLAARTVKYWDNLNI